MPAASLTAFGGFSSPVRHGGSMAPKPVPHNITVEPRGAGFNELFCVPSSFTAAACDETPGWRRKRPFDPKVTLTATGPDVTSLYLTLMFVDVFPLISSGAMALICREWT